MMFNQLKPGMYIYDSENKIMGRVIETRFYYRGYTRRPRTSHGTKSYGNSCLGMKLIFGAWDRTTVKPARNRKKGLACLKMSYSCPFKKLAKEYGCKDTTDRNIKYYCRRAPSLAKDLKEVNKLIGMLRVIG